MLDELRRQRRSLPSYMPLSDGGVITAQKVADTAAAQRLAECDASRGGRGAHCRDREADERLALAALAKAQTDKAITDQAAALDAKIAAAEGALSQVDMRAAHREADPQSAALASLTGYDQTKVAAILQIVLAVAVEFGSGVGFWLVFGHGPRRRHEDDVPMFAADFTRTALVLAKTARSEDLIETPGDIIERFFLEVIRPTVGKRASSAAVSAAYEAWCRDRGFEPVSSSMFGRLAPWRKARIGGYVWYLDAVIADAYDVGLASPTSVKSATPRLGPMVRTIN